MGDQLQSCERTFGNQIFGIFSWKSLTKTWLVNELCRTNFWEKTSFTNTFVTSRVPYMLVTNWCKYFYNLTYTWVNIYNGISKYLCFIWVFEAKGVIFIVKKKFILCFFDAYFLHLNSISIYVLPGTTRILYSEFHRFRPRKGDFKQN